MVSLIYFNSNPHQIASTILFYYYQPDPRYGCSVCLHTASESLAGVNDYLWIDGTSKSNGKQKPNIVCRDSKSVRLKISSSEKNLAASASPEQVPTNQNEPKPSANTCTLGCD